MVLGDLFFPLRTLYYKCFYLVAFLATSRLFQCSCLENPRDGGAWWAAVYGVAQGQTRLKRLSSSSSRLYTASAQVTCTKTAMSWDVGSGDVTVINSKLKQKASIFVWFVFQATTCGLQDLNSPTKDWTWAPAMKAPSPYHWTIREFSQYLFDVSKIYKNPFPLFWWWKAW